MDSPKEVRDVLSGQFLSLALMFRLQAQNTASTKPNRRPKKEDITTPTGGGPSSAPHVHTFLTMHACALTYVCLQDGVGRR